MDRVQQLARRYRYAIRLDIVKHFPSIDHAVLLNILRTAIADPRILDLASGIIASGDGVPDQECKTRQTRLLTRAARKGRLAAKHLQSRDRQGAQSPG